MWKHIVCGLLTFCLAASAEAATQEEKENALIKSFFEICVKTVADFNEANKLPSAMKLTDTKPEASKYTPLFAAINEKSPFKDAIILKILEDKFFGVILWKNDKSEKKQMGCTLLSMDTNPLQGMLAKMEQKIGKEYKTVFSKSDEQMFIWANNVGNIRLPLMLYEDKRNNENLIELMAMKIAE